jgi:poly-gamma-glutamate capsule biosynthesis protein CapA/YwtB (metallophosphatase superfamily)
MRRVAIVFAILLIALQPRTAGAPRGLIGLLGDMAGAQEQLFPATTDSPPSPPLPAVTVQSVFSTAPAGLIGLDKHKITTLIATGDVIPARSVNYEMAIRGDFTYPFQKTDRYTRAADLTLINLESPLIAGCQLTNDGFTFCGDPRVTTGLQMAGVDIANLPNNHIGNYGVDAIHETEAHLTAAGIAWDGFGHIVYKTVHRVRFAFLGFNGVGEDVDLGEMKREIRHARTKADVVVVSFHWGREYTAIPLTAPGIANQDPRVIAHAAVDDGADLIIGNHPHWVQGIEIYKSKFICYAHGNFVFDQMWSMETRHGVVGTYTFYGKQLIGVHYRAVQIENYAQPHFLSAAAEAPIIGQMRDSSLRIARGYKASDY